MNTRGYTKNITSLALFSAIIIVMTFVPYVGYIMYGGLSITTLHIPVIIGAVLLGPLPGLVLGLVWGVTCLIYAVMQGTFDAVIFLNPMISVVPRVIVGFAAGIYYQLLSKRFKTMSMPLTAILATLTNTVLVLGAIQIFGGVELVTFADWIKNVILIAVGINGIVEVVLSVILVTAITKVVLAVRKS